MIFSLYLSWTEQLHNSWPSKFTFDVEFWKQVPPNEPYRVIIGDVRDKLYHTRERTRQLLSNGFSEIPEEATYTNIEQVCNTSLLLVFFDNREIPKGQWLTVLCGGWVHSSTLVQHFIILLSFFFSVNHGPFVNVEHLQLSSIVIFCSTWHVIPDKGTREVNVPRLFVVVWALVCTFIFCQNCMYLYFLPHKLILLPE